MSGARDWLKKHQTATVQDLSNDMWVRIERTNRMLEQYGRGDFVENMPVLFALYYCTAITVMQIPEEPTGIELQKLYLENVRNLENECLIDEKESAHRSEEHTSELQSRVDISYAGRSAWEWRRSRRKNPIRSHPSSGQAPGVWASHTGIYTWS